MPGPMDGSTEPNVNILNLDGLIISSSELGSQ